MTRGVDQAKDVSFFYYYTPLSQIKKHHFCLCLFRNSSVLILIHLQQKETKKSDEDMVARGVAQSDDVSVFFFIILHCHISKNIIFICDYFIAILY